MITPSPAARSHPAIAALLAGGPPSRSDVADFLDVHDFPLLEPGWCTFAWQGGADRVELLRWIQGGVDRTAFHRLEDTDLWLLRMAVKDEGRFEYKLAIVRNGGEDWIVDPLNPDRATDPYGENSVSRTFGYAQPDWSVSKGAPAGHVETVVVDSHAFGEPREARMYLPAGYDAEKTYPLVIFHDGDDFVTHGNLSVSLDNLIDGGDVPPFLAALIQTGDRLGDYAGGRRHARCSAQVSALSPLSRQPFVIPVCSAGWFCSPARSFSTNGSRMIGLTPCSIGSRGWFRL